MSSELKVILLKGIEEDFQEECNGVVERLEHIKSLLVNIATTGSWRLPITVMGMETHSPEYERDLNLLERCGLVKSRVKFTERNSYRVYELSQEGAALVKRLDGHKANV